MACSARREPHSPANSHWWESPALRGPGTRLTACRVCCDDDPCIMKAAVPCKSLCDPLLTQFAVAWRIDVAMAAPSSSHSGNSIAHLADGGRRCRWSNRAVWVIGGNGGCIELLLRTVTLVSWRLKIAVTLVICEPIWVSNCVRVDRTYLA